VSGTCSSVPRTTPSESRPVVTMSLAAFRDVAAAAARTYALWVHNTTRVKYHQNPAGTKHYSGIREGVNVFYVPYSIDSGIVVWGSGFLMAGG